MFEINSKVSLDTAGNDDDFLYSPIRYYFDEYMGVGLSDDTSYVMLTGLGVPNKVSQAGRIGRDDNKRNGWTSDGGYTAIDGVQAFEKKPYVKCGLPAINIEIFGDNEIGGFVSHFSPVRSMDMVLNGLYLNRNAKEVTLPPSVKYIRGYAFERFENLERIIIPNDVTMIEDAFIGCPNLTRIDIKGSVGKMGMNAIYACNNLTSINIKGDVGEMDCNTISNCDNLTSINIGGNVGVINEEAFSDCPNLKYITVNSNNKND